MSVPTGLGWGGWPPVPEGWTAATLGRAGILVGGSAFPHDAQGSTDGEIPFFKVSDLGRSLDSRHMGEGQHRIALSVAQRLRATIVPSDAVVWAKIGAALLLNRRRVTREPACIDNNMTAFVPHPRVATSSWAYYWTSTLDFGAFANPGAVPSLSEGSQARLPVLLPPLDLQRRIVAFLDYETARIDELLQEQARLTSLLSEEMYATVWHGVRGANESGPRVDSGHTWLGDLPAAWGLEKLARYADCLDGKRVPLNAETRAEMQGDVPYWGANGVVDYVDRALFDEILVLVGEDGAPFFDRSRPVAFVVDEPIWPNNHIHVLRTRQQSPKVAQWLAHVLNVTDYVAFIDGSTRDKLTQGELMRVPVPVPPQGVLERILHEIDSALSRAQSMIGEARAMRAVLSERRSALITAAVTGQIDVSTWTPPDDWLTPEAA